MTGVSIADAKARFAEVVHQAEGREPVRITRRGKAVAVLLSEADYQRLTDGNEGLLAFTRAWRSAAAQAGVMFTDGQTWQQLRDQTDRALADIG